jgi:phosphoglycerol transferase MdoB-like AlkP superfamily enzyme
VLGWVLALTVVMAVALVLLTEALQREGLREAWDWFSTHGAESSAGVLVASLLGLVVVGLTGRPIPGLALTGAVLLLLGLVNRTKMGVLGKPLFPWDLFLHQEATELAPYLWKAAGWKLGILLLLGSCTFGLLAWRAPGPRPGPGLRVSLLLVVALVYQAAMPRPSDRLQRYGIRHTEWQQEVNYQRNGLLLAFALNASSVAVRRPKAYGPERVAALLPRAGPPLAGPERQRPNLIVIMSESFFDPTHLPGVTFSEDPLPNLHRLQAEQVRGELYSPVFAGGTANTEFEFLTGQSVRFLPPGALPYQQYIRRKLPSLASLLKDQGYRTVGLHTYHGWFWERNQVYAHLGFDAFISREDMPDARKDGKYISDAVITEYILREHAAATGPLFVFAVTMENHGPYDPDRYPETPVRISGPFTEETRRTLEAYTEGVRHSDRELGALVEHFSQVSEPTFIVFFGDHLPGMGPVYEQTGAIRDLSRQNLEETKFMHRVPLLIWSNTGLAPRDLGGLSPAFLTPTLLELAGLPDTPYWQFVRGVRDRLPVLMQGLACEPGGVCHSRTPEALRPLEEDWWTLQYDLLFGRRHQLDVDG